MNDPTEIGYLPFYLLKDGVMTVTYDPPFAGQYGDLPYQDPWWKVLLIILAVILAIAAIWLWQNLPQTWFLEPAEFSAFHADRPGSAHKTG
jgi:hypothetical protein